MYDYLIVGAGLFGAVFAREATDRGQRCLVIDRRAHIAGNIYTERTDGIDVHVYGAHIFHTSDEEVWRYVNRFARFDAFVNSPVASYRGQLFNLPFNMNTFYQLWGVRTPAQAEAKIASQRLKLDREPANLEEQALCLAGTDIYEKLIKGYTEKQWGRPCAELPAFIIRRVPLRMTFDNNYFADPWQGIPTDGYTALVANLLEGIEVRLETEYSPQLAAEVGARRLVYTGPIDEYYGYRFGNLAYRSLRFESVRHELDNVQGNAVINYTSADEPYTRTIEHRHFQRGCTACGSVVTTEYPALWQPGDEPYYPINDEANNRLYEQYRQLADQEQNVLFGGRLGGYKYYDMDKTVAAALEAVRSEG
jgi:UDP-galactopyranose mutase